MFERYTEKARRIIFFARYEASQYGAGAIEPEHILLGLVREDRGLVQRIFPRVTTVDVIRKEIDGRIVKQPWVSTSVDLPLSEAAKQVLHYASEESERLQDRYIGPEHLLLGLLRQEQTIPAEILYEQGLRLNAVREELGRTQSASKPAEAGDPFGGLLETLERKDFITLETFSVEAQHLKTFAPFQALLNLLARKGILSAEEYKQLSLGETEAGGDKPSSSTERD